MLISVAKIRQVSEFAKLLAEILSEVAKRKKRKPLTSVSYSHLWGTDQKLLISPQMPVTIIAYSKIFIADRRKAVSEAAVAAKIDKLVNR